MNTYWQDKKASLSKKEWDELMALRNEAYAACGKVANDPVAAERRANRKAKS